MSSQLKRRFKDRISIILNEKAKVQIGKKGLTEAVFSEINKQLALQEIIKIKFLNNYHTENMENDITKITKETNSQIIDIRGKVIILYKQKKE